MRVPRLLRYTWVVACATCLVDAAPVRDDGFLAYWAKFRADVLRGDVTSLVTLSRFPLKVSLLSDPQDANRITRAQFPALFRTELKCPSEDRRPMMNVIRDGVKFTGNNYHNAETASVDGLSFRREAEQWKLTQLDFSDTNDFNHRLHGRC